MPWFRQPDVPKKNEIVAEIEERNLQYVHDNVDKCLTKFCKEMGMMPKDVRHRLEGYDAERKRWKQMNMKTIYRFHNDPDKLSLMIHLDTRMTKEEEEMIAAMSMDELMTFCNYENHKKLSQFFKEHAEMTSEETGRPSEARVATVTGRDQDNWSVRGRDQQRWSGFLRRYDEVLVQGETGGVHYPF
jgi:hypothetical protein